MSDFCIQKYWGQIEKFDLLVRNNSFEPVCTSVIVDKNISKHENKKISLRLHNEVTKLQLWKHYFIDTFKWKFESSVAEFFSCLCRLFSFKLKLTRTNQ